MLSLPPLAAPPAPLRCRDTLFVWGQRTYVMGVINVTPDSFSGDGLGTDVEAAVALGQAMVAQGADLLDVGGESTRPGHDPVPLADELHRVLPVIAGLRAKVDVPISIDSYKTEVARQAMDAGADLINDIWGLKGETEKARLAAERRVPLILMHNQEGTAYRDLLPDIISSLSQSVSEARRSGVDPGRIIVDPGIGFGKTWQQNLEVLRRLGELKVLGLPLLLGTSRKSTIGVVLDLPADQRLEGTAATVALGIAAGADIVRVHDVHAMVRVARMADAIVRGSAAADGSARWAPGALASHPPTEPAPGMAGSDKTVPPPDSNKAELRQERARETPSPRLGRGPG